MHLEIDSEKMTILFVLCDLLFNDCHLLLLPSCDISMWQSYISYERSELTSYLQHHTLHLLTLLLLGLSPSEPSLWQSRKSKIKAL